MSGFAALLSALLPGLGQIYQGRWVRGLLMLLMPALALSLLGAFVLVLDPVLRAVVRNAELIALLVLGALFAFHLVVVVDAFAGRAGNVLGRTIADAVMLAVVTLVLAGVYGTVYRESSAWAALVARVFEPIARPLLPGAVISSPPPEWSGRDRLNVLILGIDRRAEDPSTLNTDTLIVLSLDPVGNTAAMLSIPRDTLVSIPGHGKDKVNAAYSYGGESGGADLARRTVEGLLRVPIHSYALIDFEAFTGIVDAFGGVLVDVRRPLRDEEYPTADFGIERLQFAAGPQLLSGADALRYARSRHDSNDFSRARRQQDVITGLRARMVQGGVGRIPGVMDRVGTAVETSFDPADLLPLARTGVRIDAASIRSEVLLPCNAPGAEHCELTEEDTPLGYYLIPNDRKIAELVRELFYPVR